MELWGLPAIAVCNIQQCSQHLNIIFRPIKVKLWLLSSLCYRYVTNVYIGNKPAESWDTVLGVYWRWKYFRRFWSPSPATLSRRSCTSTSTARTAKWTTTSCSPSPSPRRRTGLTVVRWDWFFFMKILFLPILSSCRSKLATESDSVLYLLVCKSWV